MRPARLAALFFLLVAVMLPASMASGATSVGRYIVVLKSSVSDPGAVAADQGRRYGAQVRYVYRSAIKGYSATIPTARLDAVRSDSRVAYVSVDGVVHATAQTLPTGVDRIQGDVSSTQSGDGSGSVGVGVAVIDTGSGPHSELNVAGGKNCQSGTSYSDQNGHGTHVAGTIAAIDNAAGVVGVAPGAPIYSVRVLDASGSGSWSQVICGIDWVTANAATLGIKVANMSLGGSGTDGSCTSDAMHNAICNSVNAGVTYVVAAGNSNSNFSSQVPAAYDQVLTVTAVADFNGQPGGGAGPTCRTDVDDTAADFSSYTTPTSADASHTIAAPGVCINSTWMGGGYNTISGTSMATPHVAGAVALCLSRSQATGGCAGMTPSQIRAKLRADAAAQASAYGFTGDPNHPITSGSRRHKTTRYYGFLVYVGGY
jgi:subtilisin family serine protease